ncbi:sensor histidine kinase [Thermoflavimicrobium daqui]|uniref:histidine kinase n=1 Tax=Thermoflavimicrobium daqui TaxID=2137476 RepID=A0A364K0Q9_9BACL|nr:histidine kinase [Thermoflavimicrobium daqui]RAL21093.1 two-component sensor histidine kinase [Thermoflavimicrobium daqui]
MSYKQAKWLILIIPTLTIGLWEYVRHAYLLPYISMDLGNWLSPVIVFFITMTFLVKLFSIMEGIQEELKKERAVKAALEERERIARELHDGIAQSLFLLAVKVEQMERANECLKKENGHPFQEIKKTVHQVNEYVRQAIANLRYPANASVLPWMESMQNLTREFQEETGINIMLEWFLPEKILTVKEKIELYSSIREGLINIRKHARAKNVWIISKEEDRGWLIMVRDDGKGFDGDPFSYKNRFGLQIMRRRALEMNWELQLQREKNHTILLIRKRRKVNKEIDVGNSSNME